MARLVQVASSMKMRYARASMMFGHMQSMSNIADLGRLHQLLTEGLPDLVEADGRLNVQVLANHLKISDKALYASFKRERVSSRQMNALVRLSNETRPRKDFKPITHSDLAEFMAK